MTASPKKRQTSRRKPSVPRALRLDGCRLEDFLPLLPAEKLLRDRAASGEECVVDGFEANRPDTAARNNTVRSQFLRYMILGGCEKSPVQSKGISLKGGYIDCSSAKNW